MSLRKIIRSVMMLAGLALAISSCKKDFLNKYPEGQLNEPVYYKTTSDFQQALVGVYAPMRDAAAVTFFMEEMRGDNAYYDYNTKDRGGAGYENLSEFMDVATNAVPLTVWTADFKGIQRANIILDKLALARPADMTDAIYNQIVGETKALRAHYYFELARLFGPLPMYLHETTGSSNAFVYRVKTVDTVYTQIIADFTDALASLAPPAKFPQTGRVTKGMVATELGLVYLTLKQYDKATPLFQSVTQMGYDLVPSYADAFDPAASKKNGIESIFEVQYKAGTDGQSSSFIYRFIPVTPSTFNILGVDYKNTVGGWNIPTDDLLSTYEPGDKRKDISVGLIKGKINTTQDFVPDSVVSILSTTPLAAGQVTRRFDKKQYHLPYGLQNNTDDNWPLYRYSDLLLMLAESLNEQGHSGDALPYLNKVRHRAGLGDVTVTDQAVLRDTIAHERRVELAFENHRWFDLVRTDQAIPVMTAYGIKQKLKYLYLLPASYNVTTDRLVYGIPSTEITYNPTGLWQNHGY